MIMAKCLVVTVIMLLSAALCAAGGAPGPLKVGFIYVGPVGDYAGAMPTIKGASIWRQPCRM
jgi:hypothetical protein